MRSLRGITINILEYLFLDMHTRQMINIEYVCVI